MVDWTQKNKVCSNAEQLVLIVAMLLKMLVKVVNQRKLKEI